MAALGSGHSSRRRRRPPGQHHSQQQQKMARSASLPPLSDQGRMMARKRQQPSLTGGQLLSRQLHQSARFRHLAGLADELVDIVKDDSVREHQEEQQRQLDKVKTVTRPIVITKALSKRSEFDSDDSEELPQHQHDDDAQDEQQMDELILDRTVVQKYRQTQRNAKKALRLRRELEQLQTTSHQRKKGADGNGAKHSNTNSSSAEHTGNNGEASALQRQRGARSPAEEHYVSGPMHYTAADLSVILVEVLAHTRELAVPSAQRCAQIVRLLCWLLYSLNCNVALGNTMVYEILRCIYVGDSPHPRDVQHGALNNHPTYFEKVHHMHAELVESQDRLAVFQQRYGFFDQNMDKGQAATKLVIKQWDFHLMGIVFKEWKQKVQQRKFLNRRFRRVRMRVWFEGWRSWYRKISHQRFLEDIRHAATLLAHTSQCVHTCALDADNATRDVLTQSEPIVPSVPWLDPMLLGQGEALLDEIPMTDTDAKMEEMLIRCSDRLYAVGEGVLTENSMLRRAIFEERVRLLREQFAAGLGGVTAADLQAAEAKLLQLTKTLDGITARAARQVYDSDGESTIVSCASSTDSPAPTGGEVEPLASPE